MFARKKTVREAVLEIIKDIDREGESLMWRILMYNREVHTSSIL